MIFKLINWLGVMQPEQRARREVAEIDRQVYDAEKALHSARATLAYLAQRRDFLIAQYDFQDPPSSFANLAALAPPARKVSRRAKKPQPSVQTITGTAHSRAEIDAAYDAIAIDLAKKKH